MKKLLGFTMVLVAVAFMPASATIINVPADQPTIQAGINASSTGDTVLVQPDTYVENIDFNGHNVVLASLFLTTGDPTYISSTIIDGNAADRVVKFVSGETSDAKIIGFTIANGSTPYTGAGICCLSASSPVISNNIITGNISTNNHGGGIYCTDNSNPTISNNIITGNQAQLMGGGISCYTASPIITNNTISGNTAVEWDGGGIDCYDDANPTIAYNIITGNSARYGGGIDCSEYSHATITNNTISENTASIGGGILCWDSNPNITNTIFWDDSAPNGPEIYVYGSANPAITYCDVEGGWTDEGNIDCDPQFCYPDTGNYYLMDTSCCVGAGCNSLGNPDTTVDIGAFGVGCGYLRGDANGDGVIEIGDVVYLINYLYKNGPAPDPLWIGDCNSDEVVDLGDVVFLINYLFKGGPPPCEP